MKDKTILVIDDDTLLLRLIEQVFSREGARVYTAHRGQEGLRLLHAHRPHLVLLDVMMPDMDGWEVCASIRQQSDVPIIFLTALGRENDIVRGLEDGAVDFVSKPASPKILLARARAALRQGEQAARMEETHTYRDDYLIIDLGKRWVLAGGQPVKLTAVEYRLLAYLLQNAGQAISLQQIFEEVWGFEHLGSVNYVRAYIWQLRQKLEEDPQHPQYLKTEEGVGYWFQKLPPGGAASNQSAAFNGKTLAKAVATLS